MFEWVKLRFVQIPIVGIIGKMKKEALREASIEMIITVLFSTLPIWLGGLILAINQFFAIDHSARSLFCFWELFKQSLFDSVSNGELLMYAAATLGPTLYLGLSNFGRTDKPFPWIRPQLIISILINVLATVLFFMARDKNYSGDSTFVRFTIIPYILSLLLLFPAMAFEHEKRKAIPSKAQREDEMAFTNGYKSHRG